MRIHISYRYTGEDLNILRETIQRIENSLTKAGYKCDSALSYDNVFVKKNSSQKEILEYTFKEILEKSDAFLPFINSHEKSEGMLLEAGYAIAKGKKVFLAIRKDVKTSFLREIADTVIEFDTLDDLYEKLENLQVGN